MRHGAALFWIGLLLLWTLPLLVFSLGLEWLAIAIASAPGLLAMVGIAGLVLVAVVAVPYVVFRSIRAVYRAARPHY